MRVTILGVLLISSVALAGGGKLEPDDLPGPAPEVAQRVKLDVPAVPGFELPAVEPGFHTPRELRVHGKPVLGTEIKVKGYVTWIYDCPTALASTNPTMTRAQILVAIDKDPTVCERAKFYLGDAKGAARDASIWIIDVPRPPNKLERQRLPKAELAAWPAVPRLAIGDHVVVTGTWAMQSPHSERNTDGLLVYKALDHAVAAAAAPAAPAPTPVADAPNEPEIAVVTKVPLRKPIDDKLRNASVDQLNACNKAIAARQYDAGIAACEAATKIWDGNHLAWYARASAHMAKNEWALARAAVEHAVTQRPDQGMYQLYHGISLYEAEHQQAREDQARKENKKPDEASEASMVTIDPSVLKLEPARDALRRATRLAPDLWRAHYYLGRVYRELDDARHAAEQFSQTITTYPAYRFGYIALIELYRRWDYLDQALAVALLGTTHVPPAEVAELWFEAGMAHDARHADGEAVAAFTKAIAARPDDAGSKFQRGQIYLRQRDFENARRDLQDVVKSTDPRLASVKPLATQLLGQIAGKRP
jgi:tetratricopeptide (TPR) repeat protein